jgi:hypothetical protein
VEFSLFDEQMNGIYQVNLPISQQAGLVNIRLPETAPALAQDKPYYWSVLWFAVQAIAPKTWLSVVGLNALK